MSKKRHRSRRPKGKKNKRILNSVKENVIQLRAMGTKYNDIADKTNLGYSTVEHICTKWAESNPDRVKLARARAMEELAGRLQEKALEALDNITVDSMTHDRVEQFNAAGQLIGVQHSGPNAPQLATASAILVDKSILANEQAAKLRGEQSDSLGPTDFVNLIESIANRITRLQHVNADLDTGELMSTVIDLKEQVQDQGEIPADFETIEEEEG